MFADQAAVSKDAYGHYYCSFTYEAPEHEPVPHETSIVAFDLGIKTLATGVNERGRLYHIGGFKGYRWYNKQLDKIRSKRDRCKKKSRRYIHLSKVYKRVSERKRNKQKDCLHKASYLIAHRLAERAVVIGDLSKRQMVMKEHQEKNKHRNRMVYNDWGLYGFVQMLTYKCLLYGKELHISVSGARPRHVLSAHINRRCRSTSGYTLVRTVDSRWIAMKTAR